MVRKDGTDLHPIATTPAVEDAVSISPDGKFAAYASTAGVYTSNIWLTEIETGHTRNLTNQTGVTGIPESPSGFFAPSWSPCGQWIVFSSDRNTNWTGHDDGIGWEHTQNLSIYAIRPDGTGFREVYNDPAYTHGSPKFSPDGKRIVFYEMTLQDTWDARSAFNVNSMTNQIVSVDFATGTNKIQHTNSSGCKLYPQYVTKDNIGYLVKGGTNEGIRYTSKNTTGISGGMRSPAWSPDGKFVVYEKTDWTSRPLEKKLYSWDPAWEYRFIDTFPNLSPQGKLVYTSKQTSNSSIVTMNPDGSDYKLVFDVDQTNQVDMLGVAQGSAGAFQPSWSYDGEWITFGLGTWFQGRYSSKAWIYRVRANGSDYEQLTGNTTNSGFPSYSPDGSKIVYRVFLPEMGLRVLDLATRETTVLTTERDNLPWFSPNGEWVLFTRNVTDAAQGYFSNYEICVIRPNGSDLTVLTFSAANDAHATWTADGRIMWSTGMWGFQAEAATYDQLFQPYGNIMIMNVDGSNKTMLTNSMWEDSMPLYIPNSFMQ
ncbi:Six-bladed beta-propeller TolB-like protein [Macrophomina phaseolina MS6]|uniref:Six-bladed beta-propeller TolB-like protein n=1 Tax=Macrophomina phaseolina (strain MS6) TaxID=1126212 RepID=K2R955_MACPH|nr:Six-bladed beta-propeller TolB-like protein [Macrophomina phaseolina MS6]